MKKSTLYGIIVSALLLAFGGMAGGRFGFLSSVGAAVSATAALASTLPWRQGGKYRVVAIARPGASTRYRLEPARENETTRTTEGPQFNVYVYVFDDYRSAKAFLKGCRAKRK